MPLMRGAIAVGALLCGVRAMGYWVILQLGGVRPPERSGIALVMCCSALLFLLLCAASAYLRQRASGARAVLSKALNLTGAYGLPPIAVFAVASRGAVLRMPEVTALVVLFVCFVLVFRPAVARQNG